MRIFELLAVTGGSASDVFCKLLVEILVRFIADLTVYFRQRDVRPFDQLHCLADAQTVDIGIYGHAELLCEQLIQIVQRNAG